MPETTVNGVSIAYEAFGRGPLLVWTHGGSRGRDALSYLWAGRFANQYTVLLWDRRNAEGASGVALSDDLFRYPTDARDLHCLLRELRLGPACLAGGSAGCIVSLLVARDHPEHVKSLILLHPPTDDDDPALATPYAEPCFRLAEAAEHGGMQRVIDASTEAWHRERQGEAPGLPTWPAETIHQNPSNREGILSLDPQGFARMLRRWGEFILSMGWLPFLTEKELQVMSFPAMVIPGRDENHPRRSAERLARLLKQGVLTGYPQDVSEDAPVFEGICTIFPAMDGFLARTHLSDRTAPSG